MLSPAATGMTNPRHSVPCRAATRKNAAVRATAKSRTVRVAGAVGAAAVAAAVAAGIVAKRAALKAARRAARAWPQPTAASRSIAARATSAMNSPTGTIHSIAPATT